MITKKNSYIKLWVVSLVLFAMFAGLVVMLKTVDVQAIGPNLSEIGLATINEGAMEFANIKGINDTLYEFTEVLGYAVIALAGIFALLGLYQLISRKSLKKIDTDIILLAVFYIATICAYVVFEIIVVNYRPVLLNDKLEASFPSSHTMLALCIAGTSIYQFNKRLNNIKLRISAITLCAFVSLLIVMGRFLSGVHWFTDIIGAILLSGALVSAYLAACQTFTKKQDVIRTEIIY